MTYRRCARGIVGCAATCIALTCAARGARAVDAFWSNSRGDGSGMFSSANNWSPSVPGASDVAHFGMTTSSLPIPTAALTLHSGEPTSASTRRRRPPLQFRSRMP
jgi:hypothetical protein